MKYIQLIIPYLIEENEASFSFIFHSVSFCVQMKRNGNQTVDTKGGECNWLDTKSKINQRVYNSN